MHNDLERARDNFREQRALAVVLVGSVNDAMGIGMRRVHALNQLTRDLSGGQDVEYKDTAKARVGEHHAAMVRKLSQHQILHMALQLLTEETGRACRCVSVLSIRLISKQIGRRRGT